MTESLFLQGSWLAIWLKELGADVIGYSLDPPSEPNNFEATRLREKITHIHGDIHDLDRLMETFKKYQPEFVFHRAAQPIVRLSYAESKMTFDTNVGGTVNVFEAVRKTPSVKVLVNITSDKCYENREWIWGYRENDPLGGHDPYNASKGCAELVFSVYRKLLFSQNTAHSRTIGAASARAGNVIGGGDRGADRLVPDCIRALSSHQPIGIRSPHAICIGCQQLSGTSFRDHHGYPSGQRETCWGNWRGYRNRLQAKWPGLQTT